MSQAGTKSFFSIGDVVEELKGEFPEVSVSKVRFLESEGLIEPERTPSGYRKFHTSDLARLRYILRLQRDQFVPLKVIRQKLEHYDPSEETPSGEVPKEVVATEADEDLGVATGVSLSLEELAAASGVDADVLRELEEYGLIDPHPAEGEVRYDEDDLLVAKIAKDFGKYGIEPRHMRMYRHFADREAGLFDQVVIPRSRSSSDGRRQVTQSLTELTKLSRRLKHALLKAGLREHLQG